MEISEHVHVRNEAHERSVLLLCADVVLVGDFFLQSSPSEGGVCRLAVAVGLNVEI